MDNNNIFDGMFENIDEIFKMAEQTQRGFMVYFKKGDQIIQTNLDERKWFLSFAAGIDNKYDQGKLNIFNIFNHVCSIFYNQAGR